MVQFQTTDTAFHSLRNLKYILPVYQYIDRCVGEIIEVLGNNTDIFIVSDHGIGKAKWKFCLNSWLQKEGFLADKRIGSKEISFTDVKERKNDVSGKRGINMVGKIMFYLGKLGITIAELDKTISVLKLDFIKDLLPQHFKNQIPRRQIDWERTKAYCPSGSSMSIRVNLEERESSGVVKTAEYTALRDTIINRLRLFKDPDGNPVFEAVLPREAYYRGQYLSCANDIMLFPRDMDYVISADILKRLFLPFTSYTHKMNGLFIAAGPNIDSKGRLDNKVSLLDVAPTILHLAGFSVPEDIDGRVSTEIFREDSEPARRKVNYRKMNYEEKKIRETVSRLKKLGKL